ncbi:glutathione S-transferase family protein [Leptospira fluminis]|uniref:Glutathione S-transferase family protein n=1 Tax=Leptospira fluminis TaxID=2484979 RepID=A0A4R9GNC5_9LEPT|nr:glutathione S-transferase family protein [Leptospira fluminis]TGK17351.1 glutathione S-transferase family protein [Leptospira fluminis]
MIRLYGYPISNYSNKVKLFLLEKGLDFEEIRIPYSQDEEFLKKSPMGKIPFLETDGRYLFESGPIIQWIEDSFPESKKLFPQDPFEAAFVRSMIVIIENYVDLPARKIYTPGLQRKPVSEETILEAKRELERGTAALARIVRFSPFIAGSEMTAADCAAFATLPLVIDNVSEWLSPCPVENLPGLKQYLEMMNSLPGPAKVEKARTTIMKALRRSKK